MAAIKAKVAIPEDTQACYVRRFLENTFHVWSCFSAAVVVGCIAQGDQG